jgi:hypothetical protein
LLEHLPPYLTNKKKFDGYQGRDRRTSVKISLSMASMNCGTNSGGRVGVEMEGSGAEARSFDTSVLYAGGSGPLDVGLQMEP